MIFARVRARMLPAVLALSVAVAMWVASRAHAQAFGVLVRQAAPEDAALSSRIRGQTSDLPIALHGVTSAPLEPALREQLAAARALVQDPPARIVVWAVRSDAALTLVVADLELDRVLVRELPAADSERDRSARDEAAALVVRTAIKAALAGEPMGQAERELAPAPVQAEGPVIPEPPKPAEPAPPAIPRPALQGLLSVGGLWAADGLARNDGLTARVALLRGRWEAGLRGSFGFAERLHASPANVDLSQHRAALYAGFALFTRPALRVAALGAVGVNAYVSRVHARAAAFEAHSARAGLATASVGAQASYLPAFTRRRVGLALSVLAELYPERLQLSYRAAGQTVHVARAATAQPVLLFELVAPLSR